MPEEWVGPQAEVIVRESKGLQKWKEGELRWTKYAPRQTDSLHVFSTHYPGHERLNSQQQSLASQCSPFQRS